MGRSMDNAFVELHEDGIVLISFNFQLLALLVCNACLRAKLLVLA